MNQMIVYAGDHSHVKLLSALLIGSCVVLIVILLMYLFRNNKKNKKSK